jgi:hypothetical protein
MLVESLAQHIAVLLAPRAVVDLHHHGLPTAVISIIAVIGARGVEAMSKISQMGEKANRAGWTIPQPSLDKLSYRPIQRDFRVSEVVSSPEVGDVCAVARPQPSAPEKVRQFLEIQVHHEESVLKGIDHRGKAAMTHPALV